MTDEETLKKLIEDEMIAVVVDSLSHELTVYILTDVLHGDCVVAAKVASWHPMHRLIVNQVNSGVLEITEGDGTKVAADGEVDYADSLRYVQSENTTCEKIILKCEMEGLSNCTGVNVRLRVNEYNRVFHGDEDERLICDGCDEELKHLVKTDGEIGE